MRLLFLHIDMWTGCSVCFRLQFKLRPALQVLTLGPKLKRQSLFRVFLQLVVQRRIARMQAKPCTSRPAHLNTAQLPLNKASYRAKPKVNEAGNYTFLAVNYGKGEGKEKILSLRERKRKGEHTCTHAGGGGQGEAGAEKEGEKES